MTYKCSICGKTGIKLWRPENSLRPLICAECAERLQTRRKGLKIKWSKESSLHFPEGNICRRKVLMSRWTISDDGTIPSTLGNYPNGEPIVRTECLNVNLSSFFMEKSTKLIPAIPDKNGVYMNLNSIYQSGKIELWKKFPTR